MKTKLINIMLFLAVLVPSVHATIFTEDGVIDGGTYDDVYIQSDATVDMTAGTVYTMYIENLGTLNYHGGIITEVELRNSGTFNLEESSLSGSALSSWGSGNFNLDGGAYQGTLEMWEYSHNIIDSGQLTTATSDFYDYVITDIYGGDVVWNSLSLHGYSALNIYGGNVSFNSGFNLHEDAEINVHYSDIIYLNEWDEIITGYHLLDGSEFMLDQFSQYEIDQINFVPEPTTFLLFGLGGIILRRRK